MNDLKSGAYIIGLNEIAEKITASAAKISTTKGSSMEIFNTYSDSEKNRQLINKVLKSGHNSIIEHMVFNIAFENVSAVAEQFFIEFRLASFTVKSRRYVNFADSGFYVPKSLKKNEKKAYQEHIEYLFKEYAYFLKKDIPKEDARFILPYCFFSNFYCTVNARELVHMINRMNLSILPELKNLSVDLTAQLKDLSPCVYKCIIPAAKKPKKLLKPVFENIDFSLAEKVELITYPSDPMNLLKLSTEIYTNSPPENDFNISKLIKNDSSRALEQLNYGFKFNNLSLSAITHVSRHRMQNLLVPALHTVNPYNYIIPESIKNIKQVFNRYNKVFALNAEFAEKYLAQDNFFEIYPYLCLSGNRLNIMSTMNARELVLFFKLRTCERAQWEIKDYSRTLLRKLRFISSPIFEHMGPSCFSEGACPEGSLTCGKFNQIVEEFSSLDL